MNEKVFANAARWNRQNVLLCLLSKQKMNIVNMRKAKRLTVFIFDSIGKEINFVGYDWYIFPDIVIHFYNFLGHMAHQMFYRCFVDEDVVNGFHVAIQSIKLGQAEVFVMAWKQKTFYLPISMPNFAVD